jgi:hypothetical protein
LAVRTLLATPALHRLPGFHRQGALRLPASESAPAAGRADPEGRPMTGFLRRCFCCYVNRAMRWSGMPGWDEETP